MNRCHLLYFCVLLLMPVVVIAGIVVALMLLGLAPPMTSTPGARSASCPL